MVRQTIKISGIDGIALTKLDVLDELDEIKICVAYQLDGKKIDYLPAAVDDQLKVTQFIKLLKDGSHQQKVLKTLKIYRQMQKIMFPNLENLLKLKYQAYQLVQKETIQF